jgi:pimeloyl-ACP methyl ester carboxylesterase
MGARAVPAVMLVHGAWHGSWCWERVAAVLAAGGIEVHTVDLPATGREPPGLDDGAVPGLAQDAAALRGALADCGPVILCGHSYGGMVISAAGLLPQVRHLVYLCAFMPEAGETVESTLASDRRAGYWMRREGPWTVPDRLRAPAVLYGDCEAAVQAWACARLRPQASRTFSQTVADPAWRHRPSTYVICSRDRVVDPAIQRERLAPRAERAVELDAGHAPFLSRATEVAALLGELARG